MAIEKMVMMNLVGALEDEDKILEQIILMGNVHLQTDISELYESHFALHVLEESLSEMGENGEETARGPNDENYSEILSRIEYISNALNIKPKVDRIFLEKSFEYGFYKSSIDSIFQEVSPIYEEIQQRKDLIKKYQTFRENIKYILDKNIDFSQLETLHFFRYKIGMMSHENKMEIAKNYENITAIAKHIGTGEDSEVFLIIYPQKFEMETERILKSVNFEEVKIPEELKGTPKEMNEQMEEILRQEQIKLNELSQKIQEMKEIYKDFICQAITRVKMTQKVNRLKENIERGTSVFILSGWIPESQKEEITKQISTVSNKFMTVFKDINEIGKSIMPPTKLKNHKWFQPFENLVKMYGTPSYNELDPTVFLSITYLIMFGAMFGDVGQGLIFIIAGWILSQKQKESYFGPIAMRLGMSSTLFGFFFGSLFGNEEWIPHIVRSIFGSESVIARLIIHPMENMNLILISAVAFGVILILFGFGYSMINCLKEGNIKDGLFGRNGLAGLIFYIALLLIVYEIALGSVIIPKGILIVSIVITMALMVIREPLANKIQHKLPLYHEEVSSYYVESGFDIIETILSLASNTISFIRVGAFALNHVGLFLAFKTMAEMAHGGIAGIIIMIIGNIIIIGLEGLIVFIQGLRLQYYELFGKYFKGEGIEFKPIQFMD
ncbi:MAG: V-type ATP synthase subunit I [Epulopiscium sp.]|nr:V-type ATP synthase subunit I [Candidatus Epulonipiscium sp.]